MNIILIGMPGAGKSTIGVIAAKMANLHFLDTDLLIQQRENEYLWKIIDKKGVDYFLQLEETTILNTFFDHHVIATGGSAVFSEKAMAYLKSKGTVVFLDVPLKELQKRVNNFITRGVVSRNGRSLAEIYEERYPLYQKYADVTIKCSGKSMEQIASIVAQIKNQDSN